jgi:bifunctional non-homologous end joining protein LigD
MNITEYRVSKLDTKVTADIAERWQKRVVTQGLDQRGRVGADQYLDRYGKRIGAKKCVKLAIHAEAMGAQDFASRIWEKAYTAETGQTATLSLDGAPMGTKEAVIPTPETPRVDSLPEHLQPGKIATLQPQDLKLELEDYLESDQFAMQRKFDGHRTVAICTPDKVYYQKRSLNLTEAPSEAINDALLKIGKDGPAIIDGEVYYTDQHNIDHRTAAQAATANVNSHHPEGKVNARYVMFDCLYRNGQDLLGKPFLDRYNILTFVPITSDVLPADTFTDKRTKRGYLEGVRSAEGEGVVFRDIESTYLAGKSKTAYRYKFLTEHILKVIGLTSTDAEGRLFGAIETELGLVGTGFSQEDQVDIQMAWDDGDFKIEVVSQGLTENGKLWHPRFVKIV